LLTPDLPLTFYGYEGMGLLFEPTEQVWQHVQCTTPLDSNTANRACCACFERQYCGGREWLDQFDSGYCSHACSQPDDASQLLCKQLAAGCGANTITITMEGYPKGHTHTCDASAIVDGTCSLCRQPIWCDDEGSDNFGYGSARTPDEWTATFFGKPMPGTRQCKYKPSQRELLINVTREYHRRRQIDHQHSHENWRDHEPVNENEVNVYLEPDGSTQADFMHNLVGLVFLRATGNYDWHVPILKQLQEKLRELGKDVPLYALTNESPGEVVHWQFDKRISHLVDSPYSLEVVESL